MKFHLKIAAVLLLFSPLALFAIEGADSSSEDHRQMKVQEVVTTKRSWFNTLWTGVVAAPVMLGAGIYGLGKAYLPSPVKTVISYAATPITWTAKKVCSNVFGWHSIWDYLADEGSWSQWLLTDVMVGRMMGFGDGKVASKETALMSKSFILTKKRVLQREDPEKHKFTDEQEKEWSDKIEQLYERIKTPRSFTLNLCIYLSETVLLKMPGFPTSITQDEITFAAGAGLGLLSPQILKAGLMLLVKYAYLGRASSMAGMGAGGISAMLDNFGADGDEMLTAGSYWMKIMALYQKDKIMKKIEQKRRQRSQMKSTGVEIKMAAVPADHVEQMPDLFVKTTSSARASMDLWVFLMMAAMIAAVFYVAFKSGMVSAPTSTFPTMIGQDNAGMDPRCTGGDVYDMRPTRDVAAELDIADQML